MLVLLDIFNQVERTEHASLRKFVESLLASVENEFFLLDWKLFTRVDDDCFEFFLVIGLVEIDERLEIIQISLSFCVENLILVSLHLQIVSKFSEFGEEVLALFLLNEKLTVLNIKIEDSPAVSLGKLWINLIESIFSDVRDVMAFTSKEFQDLANFLLDFLNFTGEALVFILIKRLHHNIEDPLGFLL